MVKGVSKILQAILWTYAAVSLIYEYRVTIADPFYTSSAMALGGITPSIIGFAIAYACARKNTEWATKIKKSKNWAYTIGFIASLLGLLSYWIYYKTKNKKN